jgi:hypothetical protein
MLRVVTSIILAAAAGACTPLGLWIYEEPTVEVTEIRLDASAGATFPVQFALAVSNANDFDVALLRVEVRINVAGRSVVDRDVSTAADLPSRDRQLVRIGVAPGDLAPGADARAGAQDRYTIEGFAIVRTPIGERRIPFARAGTGLS